MRPHDLNDVGDEPIYCETHHDDILYYGSEDDYYEAPEHRRLRIEAKAVQFLNGNVPYLISARLKGPFDSKSWNNPWKSKRAQVQASQRQNQSQSRRSAMTVEAGRGHGSGRPTDDLPDTQRTSLYPLPSPETTNPPSARKNSYMVEEEFNRIKTWRETVKSVPVTTDPFWASHQDKSQQSTATRKRSAENDWLRKREPKKRKSDVRDLAPEESPSQAASTMRRRSLGPGRFTGNVTQSAPGSSTHEDELAARWNRKTASFNTSRMVNIPTNSSSGLHSARTPQSSTRQALARDLDSSEDELSMPSIALSRNASRSPSKRSPNSTANNTCSRRNNTNSGDVFQTCRRTNLAPNISADQRSVLRTSARHKSQGKKTAASVSATQVPREDMGTATLDNSQVDTVMSQRPTQGKSTKLAKKSLRRALGASQQDDSFYFHQAASKSPSTLRNLPTRETSLDSPDLSLGVTATATKHLRRQSDHLCAKDDESFSPAHLDGKDRANLSNGDATIFAMSLGTPIPDENMEVAGSQEDRAVEAKVAQTLPVAESQPNTAAQVLRKVQHERMDFGMSAEPKAFTPACTQELSPVSIQHNSQDAVKSPTDCTPEICPAYDNADDSNPEWSTYVNTQDLSTASKRPSSSLEGSKDIEVSASKVDENDADWTTYVDTTNITHPSFEDSTASKGVDGSAILVHNPHGTSDPEWSTLLDIQDQATAETPCEEVTVAMNMHRSKMELSGLRIMGPAADDASSSSKLSSYYSASSQGEVDQLGDPSNKPLVGEDRALDSGHSQSSLDSIINAYAENTESPSLLPGRAQTPTPLEDGECPDASNGSESGRAAQQIGADGQESTTIPIEKRFSLPVETQDEVGQPMKSLEEGTLSFDETTMSLESSVPSVQEMAQQSPWAKGGTDLPMPVITSNETTLNSSTSNLSLLAGQALAFSPAPQTPWGGDRLRSPEFTLSLKKFSDFMMPSPSKKRASSDRSILRGLRNTTRGSFGAPMSPKLKRRVTFAPLPGEEATVLAACGSENGGIYVEEDVSYFDAKGNKTASIRITRSQTRAASPPPSDVPDASGDELPDHDHKFARHFQAVSRRKKEPTRKVQRLLPAESQQTNSSQAVDAMAEAFIQASQTRKKSCELVESVDDNTRLTQPSLEKDANPSIVDAVEQAENIEPVDDVSAVLDNIDDFLDNSWGFETSYNANMEKEASTKQQAETVPSRFANVGDPMLTMHANVWAD